MIGRIRFYYYVSRQTIDSERAKQEIGDLNNKRISSKDLSGRHVLYLSRQLLEKTKKKHLN